MSDDTTIADVGSVAALPVRSARVGDLGERALAVLAASGAAFGASVPGWREAEQAMIDETITGRELMGYSPFGYGDSRNQICPWPEFDAHLDRLADRVGECERLLTEAGLTGHHTGRVSP